MRQKWLSLCLVCRTPKVGQHTRDPVCYCLCQPICPNSPVRRGPPPRLPAEGDLPLICRQTRRRISSVLSNFGSPADEAK